MERKFIFHSGKTYSEDEITKEATPITHDGDYLIADTPDREYWFLREGHFWKLDHTWGHFYLQEKPSNLKKIKGE